MRAKCINVKWKEGKKDPELTKNKWYDILDVNVAVMGNEDTHIQIVGDDGKEITRPKRVFLIFKD